MPNSERIQKWVEALRSGEFNQGTGALRPNPQADEYCCLGVACEVYRRETGQGEWRPHDLGTDTMFVIGDGPAASVLPSDVRRWFGLDSGNPQLVTDDDGSFLSLAEMNDAGASFETIADKIEAEFLG